MTGVCQKGGSTYRRFKVKRNGKWADQYVKLPDPTHPTFAAKLARLNQRVTPRREAPEGTIAALVAMKRKLLPKENMADETRRAWTYYLELIEQQHGKRMVADLRNSHCYTIRDSMMDQPGKANAYMSKLRALLKLACQRDIIATNPAIGVERLELGEYDPWPQPVLQAALDQSSPMLRLAMLIGLYTGQRIGDVIRMRHDWIDGDFMVLRSQKTNTDTTIPMHPELIAAMGTVEKRDTLIYDRFGNPFKDTDRLQARIRRLMKDLGEVGADGKPLYSFHGLSKNAICYLTELNLSDETISAITGKTPQTVRYYAKTARRWMLARSAMEVVRTSRPTGHGGNRQNNGGKQPKEKA